MIPAIEKIITLAGDGWSTCDKDLLNFAGNIIQCAIRDWPLYFSAQNSGII